MTTVRLRARHLQHDHGALARLTEHTVCTVIDQRRDMPVHGMPDTKPDIYGISQ